MSRRLQACALLMALPAVLAPPCLAHAAEIEVQVSVPSGPDQLASAVYAVPANGRTATAAPGTTATIDQVRKQYAPQVSIIQTGTSVAFPNKDNIRHHVYSFSPAKSFELKLYSGKPSTPVLFDRPGVVTLGCNIHDVMLAYVLVVDTPHFGMADAHGLALLHNVPPGDYVVHAWTPGPHQGEHPLQKLHVADGANGPLHVEVPVVSGSAQ